MLAWVSVGRKSPHSLSPWFPGVVWQVQKLLGTLSRSEQFCTTANEKPVATSRLVCGDKARATCNGTRVFAVFFCAGVLFMEATVAAKMAGQTAGG